MRGAGARRDTWAAVERDSHWWQVTNGKPPQWPRGLTRGQERVIAQLRAGKCPITAEYLRLIEAKDADGVPIESAACQCGAAAETVRHLICECPAYEKERQDLFAEEKLVDLSILARQPARVMRFLRRIRREGCAAPKEQGEAPRHRPTGAWAAFWTRLHRSASVIWWRNFAAIAAPADPAGGAAPNPLLRVHR